MEGHFLDTNWLKEHSFKEIRIEDYDLFSKFIQQSSYFTGLWASNFTYIWSLSQLKNIKVFWKIIDHMLVPFIMTKKLYMYVWCLPFGKGNENHVIKVTKKTLLLCKQWNTIYQQKKSATVNLVNERQFQFLASSPLFKENFFYKKYDSKEIIWSVPKLVQLKGKEFSEIRSLRNKLKREHPTILFREYQPTDYKSVKKLKQIWNKTSGQKYKVITDHNLFHQVIHYYQALQEKIYVATVDGKIVGIVTGAILPNGISWGCIAKTLPGYKGLSEYLYTEFAKSMYSINPRLTMLHVGSDNNQEGLRRFKEKFRPIEHLELYALKLR